jgi:hypothetical protein
MLAETYFYEAMSNWSASPEAAAERLFQLAQEAARQARKNRHVYLEECERTFGFD